VSTIVGVEADNTNDLIQRYKLQVVF